MAMAALPDLITVAQYRQLPEDGAAVYELHRGEVVVLSHPKSWHWKMQERLVDLLKPKLRRFKIGMEFAFRAIPEFDLRAADVAALARARYDAMDPADNLHGAPELVIEVKSPSNTKRQLQDYAALCLATGCLQFWILDRDSKSVTVIQRDGSRQTFGIGDAIPLAAFGGESLAVAETFTEYRGME